MGPLGGDCVDTYLNMTFLLSFNGYQNLMEFLKGLKKPGQNTGEARGMYSSTHLCSLGNPWAADTEITFSSEKIRDGGRHQSRTMRVGPGSGPEAPASWQFMPGVPRHLT